MMPLAPLDRQRAVGIVAGVKSTNGAKTGTAASLHATAQDLSAAHGAKRIILITDGEENCGGNVEKEITELRSSGFDLQLSIVGFAIDSPQVGVMFKHWAQLGGGSYFETHDAATLDAAMINAIRPQFDVVDDSGKTVATAGIGSSPLTLAAGHYTVLLHGSIDTGAPVEIQPGKNTATSLTQ
jgi:Ca-activated chloride channel family protein